jgi:hypothetical protein
MEGMPARRVLPGVAAALAGLAFACSSPAPAPGEGVGRVGQDWTKGIPACGTAIGSWNGVTAYSNGSCFGNLNCINCDGQGFSVHTSSNGAKAYGGAWQCVELVTRYLDTTYGIWLSNDAGTPLCNSAASTGGLTVYGPGYQNNSPPEPVAGDALVWNYQGGGGHTALVTGTNGTTISYLEQNWGNTQGYAATGTTGWTGSNFGAPSDSLGGYSPVCWIHANANAAATCPYGNGLYCGGNGVKGDTKTLYDCQSGKLTVAQVCGIQCQHEPISARRVRAAMGSSAGATPSPALRTSSSRARPGPCRRPISACGAATRAARGRATRASRRRASRGPTRRRRATPAGVGGSTRAPPTRPTTTQRGPRGTAAAAARAAGARRRRAAQSGPRRPPARRSYSRSPGWESGAGSGVAASARTPSPASIRRSGRAARHPLRAARTAPAVVVVVEHRARVERPLVARAVELHGVPPPIRPETPDTARVRRLPARRCRHASLPGAEPGLGPRPAPPPRRR